MAAEVHQAAAQEPSAAPASVSDVPEHPAKVQEGGQAIKPTEEKAADNEPAKLDDPGSNTVSDVAIANGHKLEGDVAPKDQDPPIMTGALQDSPDDAPGNAPSEAPGGAPDVIKKSAAALEAAKPGDGKVKDVKDVKDAAVVLEKPTERSFGEKPVEGKPAEERPSATDTAPAVAKINGGAANDVEIEEDLALAPALAPAKVKKRKADKPAPTNGEMVAKKAKSFAKAATAAVTNTIGNGGSKKVGRPKKDKKEPAPMGRTARKTRSQGPVEA